MNMTLLTKVGRWSIRFHIVHLHSWKWLWSAMFFDTMDDLIERCCSERRGE